MDYNALSLELCEKNRGKLEVVSKVPVTTREELSTAYTPGVAARSTKTSMMSISTPLKVTLWPLFQTAPPCWALATSGLRLLCL
jgi:hypothetical protein